MTSARNLPPTSAAASSVANASIAELGRQLADVGIGDELAIRRFADLARAAGMEGVALGVLADADAPEVARLRAFAAISTRLAGLPPTANHDAAGIRPVA